MKESETFCYKNQEKLLISDRHTRKFNFMSEYDKEIMIKKNW